MVVYFWRMRTCHVIVQCDNWVNKGKWCDFDDKQKVVSDYWMQFYGHDFWDRNG